MAYPATSAQIEAAMTSIASSAPTICKKTAFTNTTASEGGLGPTTYSFLEIANGSGPNRVTALAVAGMHAREWAQPDAVISFATKLVAAYQSNSAFVIPSYTEGGKTYGPVSLPAPKVKALIDTLTILLVPLANPDGRAFSQSSKVIAISQWRKNRAPRPSGGNDRSVGVDINRNFDICWDFDVFYTPAFAQSTDLVSSKNEEDEIFIGKPKAAPNDHRPDNEPEAKNLISLLTTRPVTFSIDLHSKALKVMYPWGIEATGTVAAQNFQNTAFDGKRDGPTKSAYSEFFPNAAPTRLKDSHDTIAKSMRDRIAAATGRTYDVGPVAEKLYAATGTITDFCFSRQFTVANSPPIHAFIVEFGDDNDTFQPHPTKANGFAKIEREIHAVLLAFFEAALASVPAPKATGSGGGGGSGSGTGSGSESGAGKGSSCFFTVAVSDLLPGIGWLETLGRGRDVLVGQRWAHGAMLMLDRSYRRLSRLLIPYLIERRWARRAVARGLVFPAAAITGLVLKARTR